MQSRRVIRCRTDDSLDSKVGRMCTVSATKSVPRKHSKLIAFFRSFILSRPSRRCLKQSGIYKERVFSSDLSEHLLNSGQEKPKKKDGGKGIFTIHRGIRDHWWHLLFIWNHRNGTKTTATIQKRNNYRNIQKRNSNKKYFKKNILMNKTEIKIYFFLEHWNIWRHIWTKSHSIQSELEWPIEIWQLFFDHHFYYSGQPHWDVFRLLLLVCNSINLFIQHRVNENRIQLFRLYI